MGRFVEVADRIQTSEDKAETFETADYLQDMDRYEGKNNVIPTGFDVNAAIDAAATESTTFIDVVVEETVAKVAEERKDEAAADAVAEVEKKIETKLETTMEAIEAAAVPMEEIVPRYRLGRRQGRHRRRRVHLHQLRATHRAGAHRVRAGPGTVGRREHRQEVRRRREGGVGDVASAQRKLPSPAAMAKARNL